MKKFLIWIDILGFEELAEEINKKKGIDAWKIRKYFFKNVINEKIKETFMTHGDTHEHENR